MHILSACILKPEWSIHSGAALSAGNLPEIRQVRPAFLIERVKTSNRAG
jgi:hypothetical protein